MINGKTPTNKAFKSSIAIILSAVFFGTYGIWSKMMAQEFGEFLQAWLRGVIVLLILIPIGIFTHSFKKVEVKDIKWFAIITLPGSLVFAFYYYGFEYLSIGSATLLFYASLTIFSYFAGWLFFKEVLGRIKILSLLLGILGLLLTFSISLEDNFLLPALSCILAGTCGGIEVVFTKKISDKYSPIQITTILYGIGFILNFIVYLLISKGDLGITSDITAWIALIMYAIAGLLAFFFVVLGYKHLEPSVGGIIGLLEIPFGVLFGYIFFKEVLTTSTLFGGLLIIIAAALPNLRLIFSRIKQR